MVRMVRIVRMQVRIGGIATYMFLAEWRLALVALGLVPLCAVIGKVREKQRSARSIMTNVAQTCDPYPSKLPPPPLAQ